MGNLSQYVFFSAMEGNLLIRIFLAQILAFALAAPLVPKLPSKLLGRLLLVVLLNGFVFGFTLHVQLASILGIYYVMVVVGTYFADQKWPLQSVRLNVLEKVLLGLGALVIWGLIVTGLAPIGAAIGLITNYKASLIGLGYLWILWPCSYLVQYFLIGIDKSSEIGIQADETLEDSNEGSEGSHKLIGMFERLIILTLVLLGEYAAIGFLITGKSIIRFGNKDEKIRSEYVLAGTMVSYAIAIISGVLINWLLKFE